VEFPNRNSTFHLEEALGVGVIVSDKFMIVFSIFSTEPFEVKSFDEDTIFRVLQFNNVVYILCKNGVFSMPIAFNSEYTLVIQNKSGYN
jgi:hypothetical protein